MAVVYDTKYLGEAYGEAQNYADKQIDLCMDAKSDALSGDELYGDPAAFQPVKEAVKAGVGVVLLVFAGLLMIYADKLLGLYFDADFTAPFYGWFVRFLAALLLLSAGSQIWKRVYSMAREKKAERYDELIETIRSRIAGIKALCGQKYYGIFTGSWDLAAEQSDPGRDLANFRREDEQYNGKTAEKKYRMTFLCYLVLSAAACIFFSGYIVKYLAADLSYDSTLALFFCYFLIIGLLYQTVFQLRYWHGILIKILAVLAMLATQASIYYRLFLAGDLKVDVGIAQFPSFLFEVLLDDNDGLFLTIFTIATLVLLIAVKTKRPQDEPTVVGTVDAQGEVSPSAATPKQDLKLFMVLETLYVLICSVIMSNAVKGGFGIKLILIYLLLGAISFGVNYAFVNEDMREEYGVRLGAMRFLMTGAYTVLIVGATGIGPFAALMMLIQTYVPVILLVVGGMVL